MKDIKEQTYKHTLGSDTLIVNEFSWYPIKQKLKDLLDIKSKLTRIKCWYRGHLLTVKDKTHKSYCERGCKYPVGIKYMTERAILEARKAPDYTTINYKDGDILLVGITNFNNDPEYIEKIQDELISFVEECKIDLKFVVYDLENTEFRKISREEEK
jgi:hypothetical protein